MAQTQSIRCIQCNKVLGVINIPTGDFKGISYSSKWDKGEKVIAKDEKDKNKVVKKTVTKEGHKVNKMASFNLIDAKEQYTVTCSCGQVNGIY